MSFFGPGGGGPVPQELTVDHSAKVFLPVLKEKCKMQKQTA